MKIMDMRFDKKLFKGLIGQVFHKYKCDPFVYTPSVTQIVGVYIGNQVYQMTNIQESLDYFGEQEDISVCRFEESVDGRIQSAFTDVRQTDRKVEGTIDKIVLVNEHQQISGNDMQPYDVWLTRGIVFYVSGREISFEKQNVPFSEEIIIRTGYDLIEQFGDVKAFSEEWDSDVVAKATRELIEIGCGERHD